MKFLKTLFSVLLALTGWGCLAFAWVIYGIKCMALVALAMIVTALIGSVI